MRAWTAIATLYSTVRGARRPCAPATYERPAATTETPTPRDRRRDAGPPRPSPPSRPARLPKPPPSRAAVSPCPPGDQATQVLPRTGEQPAVAAEPVATPQPEATPERRRLRRPLPRPWWPATFPPASIPASSRSRPAPSARRGKLRRRLRYLRPVRELLLRDLGGFVYEIHRTAGGTPQESHRKLVAAKAERIATLDVEVRGLESRLGEPHAEPVLREPGIGGTCPECGELHASDARYCSRCGTPLDAKARAQRDAAIAAAAAAQPTTGSHAVTEPGPASVLWAAGPRRAPTAAGSAERGAARRPRRASGSRGATSRP